MPSRKRWQERIANANDLLKGEYRGEIEQRIRQETLVGSGPEFWLVMPQLKRDNGILAFITTCSHSPNRIWNMPY